MQNLAKRRAEVIQKALLAVLPGQFKQPLVIAQRLLSVLRIHERKQRFHFQKKFISIREEHLPRVYL